MRGRLILWVIGAALLAGVGMVGLFRVVGALSSDGLTFQNPVVFSSDVVPAVVETTCTRSLTSLVIAGEVTPRGVCVSEGNGVRFGMYAADHGYGSAIGFGFDTKMYHLWAGCGGQNSCIYVPANDEFIVKKTVSFGNDSLNVYKDFSKHIKVVPGQDPLIREYSFDTSQPDYTFRTNNQMTWAVGGIGVSSNGDWLAVEMLNNGIGILNLHTFVMRKISDFIFSYGTGYNPITELAVSDDGMHVAIVGLNAWIKVYDVTDGCAETVSDEGMMRGISLIHPCLTAPINVYSFAPQFRYATQPKFDDAGGELSFYTIGGESRYVVLRAAGYGGRQLDYLALGDSFNSGEGETSDSHYVAGTNVPFEKCHVSNRSYPFLIAQTLSVTPDSMKSVACSGAVTGDVVGANASYWGQGGRLSSDGLNLSVADKTSIQASALDSFSPGRVKQVTFVKKYHPRVITIGIGGNDAGFMQKLRACLGPDTCSWAATPTGREKTALEVQRLFDTLVKTYQELVAASPGSKIYAVGYPRIISEDGRCDLLTGYLLNGDEKHFMNEGITYINQVVAAAAKRVGIMYLDVESSFGNQTLCGDDKPSAMNGIRAGDDNAISDTLRWFKIIGQESFHPTPTGHSLIAASILHDVPDLFHYENCSGGFVTCPTPRVVAPSPSAYWSLDAHAADLPRQQSVVFVNDREGATSEVEKTVVIPDYSLQPGSLATIEVNSEPIILGKFTVGSSGNLHTDITLPDDLDEGSHTVHVYGTSYSGELVDIYDVILYLKRDIVQPNQTNGSDSGSQTIDSSLDLDDSAQSIGGGSVAKLATSRKDVSGGEPSVVTTTHTTRDPAETVANSSNSVSGNQEGVLGSDITRPAVVESQKNEQGISIWVVSLSLVTAAIIITSILVVVKRMKHY